LKFFQPGGLVDTHSASAILVMISSFDNSNWRAYVTNIINAQVIICAGFMICALYLAKNNYTGFDGVFTGLLFATFIYLTNKGVC